MRNTHVTLISLAAALSGCGTFNTKNSSQTPPPNLNDTLTGTWQGGCVTADWLGLGHAKEQLAFGSLGEFIENTTVYSDASCATLMTTLVEKGTYSSLAPAGGLPNATNINFMATNYTVTPNSDAAAKLMNEAKYCGVTDWTSGTAVDITGKTCLGVPYNNGDVTFDIYQITGNQLTLGKSKLLLAKTSAGSRPTELDTSNVLTKQ